MTPKGSGGYRPILPLDALILKELPDEGAIFAVWPEGKSARELSQIVADGQVSVVDISSRLRVMSIFGLIVRTRTVRNSANIYQVTPLGKKHLASFKPKEAGDGSKS